MIRGTQKSDLITGQFGLARSDHRDIVWRVSDQMLL